MSRRYVVIREDINFEAYGRPIDVIVPDGTPISAILRKAFKTQDAPTDRKLERVLVIPVDPSDPVTAVPVWKERPKFAPSEAWTNPRPS